MNTNAVDRHAPDLYLRGLLGTVVRQLRHSCQMLFLAICLLLGGTGLAKADLDAAAQFKVVTGVSVPPVGDTNNGPMLVCDTYEPISKIAQALSTEGYRVYDTMIRAYMNWYPPVCRKSAYGNVKTVVGVVQNSYFTTVVNRDLEIAGVILVVQEENYPRQSYVFYFSKVKAPSM